LDVGLTSRCLWFALNANIDAFNIRVPLGKDEQSLVEIFAAIAARSHLTQGEWVPHIGEEKAKQVKNFLGFGKKAADELSGPEEAALLFAKNRFIPKDLGEAATDTIAALETRDRLNQQCEFEKSKASSKGEPVAGRYNVIYDVDQRDDGSGPMLPMACYEAGIDKLRIFQPVPGSQAEANMKSFVLQIQQKLASRTSGSELKNIEGKSVGLFTRLVGAQETIAIACDDVDALLGETSLKSRTISRTL